MLKKHETTSMPTWLFKKLLTTAQAAEFLEVHPWTLASWRSAKQRDTPPYVMFRGMVRYDADALQKCLTDHSIDDPTIGPRPDAIRRKAGPGRPPKKARPLRNRQRAKEVA